MSKHLSQHLFNRIKSCKSWFPETLSLKAETRTGAIFRVFLVLHTPYIHTCETPAVKCLLTTTSGFQGMIIAKWLRESKGIGHCIVALMETPRSWQIVSVQLVTAGYTNTITA